MPSFKPVTAVLRSLEVLAAVNRLGEASVSQIHKLIGLNSPTVVRMLETLQHAGYVMKDPARAVYLPTGRTPALSVGYEPYRELAVVATRILAELHSEIGWPSDLAVYDGEAMLVVHTSRDEHRLSFNRRPGYRAPMLATSLGRAYLAFCSEQERQRALELASQSPESWNDVAREPARAATLFAEVRANGYATMHEDYSEREYGGRFSAVGMPVQVNGQTIAALNMTLVRDVAESKDGVRRFVVPLQRAALELGNALLSVRAGGEGQVRRAAAKIVGGDLDRSTGALFLVGKDWMPDA
jgi:IclR family transcriptional regulator, mhp operon transcriptional activator